MQKAVHPPESILTHQPLPPLPVRDPHIGPTLVPVDDRQPEKHSVSSTNTELPTQTEEQEGMDSLGRAAPEIPSAAPTEQAITQKARRSGRAKADDYRAARQADVVSESKTESGERKYSAPNEQQTLLPTRTQAPFSPIIVRGEQSTEDRSEFGLQVEKQTIRPRQNAAVPLERQLVPTKPSVSQRADLTALSARSEDGSEKTVAERAHHLLVPRGANPESSVNGKGSQVSNSPLSMAPDVQAPVQTTRTINVTIGRVEVRATPEPRKVEYAPQPKRENQNGPSNMSLDDYLKRYNERNG